MLSRLENLRPSTPQMSSSQRLSIQDRNNSHIFGMVQSALMKGTSGKEVAVSRSEMVPTKPQATDARGLPRCPVCRIQVEDLPRHLKTIHRDAFSVSPADRVLADARRGKTRKHSNKSAVGRQRIGPRCCPNCGVLVRANRMAEHLASPQCGNTPRRSGPTKTTSSVWAMGGGLPESNRRRH